MLHTEEVKHFALFSWTRNRDRSCCPGHRGNKDTRRTGQRVQKEKELSTVNAWSLLCGLKGTLPSKNK